MNRPRAEIITIGHELLTGSVLNTNSQFLSKSLTGIGVAVTSHRACDDLLTEIEFSLGEALSRAEIVILTGGLGPTPDDITREAVAHFFKVSLKLSETQWKAIQTHYRRYGRRKVPVIVKKEALYPENAKPLVNRHGIALGFYIPCGGRVVIVLPGVPYELQRMMEELVTPLLVSHYPALKPKPKLIVKITGLSEPDVMRKLGKDFFEDSFDFGIYPDIGEVSLRLYAEKETTIQRLRNKIAKRLSRFVYAWDEISLAEVIGGKLVKERSTVAVAESCTSGLLGAAITSVAGASLYFRGGVLAYDNAVKTDLGVSPKTLKTKGAVSVDTAKEMAAAVRKKFKTDYGISITGIAGPGGGSKAKPVGTVMIAVAAKNKCRAFGFHFWGDRYQIRLKAVKKSLLLLWREISES